MRIRCEERERMNELLVHVQRTTSVRNNVEEIAGLRWGLERVLERARGMRAKF